MNGAGDHDRRQRFDHMVYHFVLTYSNWETGTVCFSESFESLAKGCRGPCGTGRRPAEHRTDRMSAAVNNWRQDPDTFTRRYQALLDHYRLKG